MKLSRRQTLTLLASAAALPVLPTSLAAQDLSGAKLPARLQMLVVPEHASPTLRIVRPGRPSSDRSIEVLFPEHITALRHGATDAQHLYMWHPDQGGDAPSWTRTANTLQYERQLAGSIHVLARAVLDPDGVRFQYTLHNSSTDAYDMIYAVTDPRLTNDLHDVRLERTYVHYSSGLELLAADTPGRLTVPLAQWLPARYLASFTWPVPKERVQHGDGITIYNTARAVDQPFIATRSSDGAWVIASFARTVGNVWSNPALTCQHTDPQTTLAPGQTVTLERKILVIPGSIDDALQLAVAQRESLI